VKFSERLKQLGFASYAGYLESDGWKAFRVRYRDAGNRMTCLVCSSRPIQLHHRTYVRLGCEEFGDVTPLCRPHHEAVHDWLKTSGRIFVEYTHEAVAALGGTLEPMPTRPGRSQKRTRVRRKRRKVKKHKAARHAALESIRDGSAAWPPTTNCPEMAATIAQLVCHQLTDRQKAAVCRFVTDGDIKQLSGLLRGVELTERRRANPRKPKKHKKSKAQERLKAARQNFQEIKRKKQDRRKSPPLTVATERKKWDDPLQAIRMLANGHRPPPK
jgi:hypothetical protein